MKTRSINKPDRNPQRHGITWTRFFSIVVVSLAFSFPALSQTPLLPGFSIDGAANSDGIGRMIAGAGDINGDGFDDIVSGQQSIDLTPGTSGSVLVYSGFDGSVLLTLTGPSTASGSFGNKVDGAGDVNNDGFDDIVVTAYLDNGGGGSVFVYSGVDGSLLHHFSGSGTVFLGYDAGGAGDVNGDGFADVVVGVPLSSASFPNAGVVRVYSGLDGTMLHDIPASPGRNFGLAVGAAGDCNGDGIADFMSGDTRSSANGTATGNVTVFSGADGSVLRTFDGNTSFSDFGFAVEALGDIDNDGFDDIAFSEAEASTDGLSDNGRVFVYSMQSGTLVREHRGTSNNLQFGENLEGCGDIDGDGRPDLAVGAPDDDSAGVNAGAVEVYSGATGALIKKLTGTAPNQKFGEDVASGDLNDDGDNDVFAGVPNASSNGLSFNGQILTFLGDRLMASDIYTTSHSIGHALNLVWIPDSEDAFSPTGTISCDGANPASFGIIAVSKSKADMLLFGFTPVVVDAFSSELLQTYNFGFTNTGTFTEMNVTRQNPALAGTYAHIQIFELAPGFPSSNGLSLLATD